jgi:hypothetical protein
MAKQGYRASGASGKGLPDLGNGLAFTLEVT